MSCNVKFMRMSDDLSHRKYVHILRFGRLNMMNPRDLIEGEASSRLNAYVAGYVSHDEMREHVRGWVKVGVASQDVYERVSFYL